MDHCRSPSTSLFMTSLILFTVHCRRSSCTISCQPCSMTRNHCRRTIATSPMCPPGSATYLLPPHSVFLTQWSTVFSSGIFAIQLFLFQVPPGMLLRKLPRNAASGRCEFRSEVGGYPALRMCQNWWNAQDIVIEYSVDEIVLGMASQIAETEDSIIIDDLRGMFIYAVVMHPEPFLLQISCSVPCGSHDWTWPPSASCAAATTASRATTKYAEASDCRRATGAISIQNDSKKNQR
jgi:hypothetical protein